MGSGYALESNDWVFPALREGGVALLRGFDFEQYIARSLATAWIEPRDGKCPATTATQVQFVSLSSPIGTQIPSARRGMGGQDSRNPDVSIGYMGDGATSEGDFHVSLNMAALQKLPVVFFCQNNQWAISLPSSLQTASETIAIKGRARNALDSRRRK